MLLICVNLNAVRLMLRLAVVFPTFVVRLTSLDNSALHRRSNRSSLELARAELLSAPDSSLQELPGPRSPKSSGKELSEASLLRGIQGARVRISNKHSTWLLFAQESSNE